MSLPHHPDKFPPCMWSCAGALSYLRIGSASGAHRQPISGSSAAHLPGPAVATCGQPLASFWFDPRTPNGRLLAAVATSRRFSCVRCCERWEQQEQAGRRPSSAATMRHFDFLIWLFLLPGNSLLFLTVCVRLAAMRNGVMLCANADCIRRKIWALWREIAWRICPNYLLPVLIVAFC